MKHYIRNLPYERFFPEIYDVISGSIENLSTKRDPCPTKFFGEAIFVSQLL